MKTKIQTFNKSSALILGALAVVSTTQASTDYGPAVWRPACNGKWYTSGYGKKFYVVHDMEGYYLSSISFLQACGNTASVHYCVNGVKDTSTDAPAGEVSQLVSDVYYAWHATCWNQSSMGTEHEGFVSNPAWYTEAMYQASAALTKSKANKYGFAKDRNHIVGHNEKSSAAWVSYANANLGINATCNTHTDPGIYWNWAHYMNLITAPPTPSHLQRDFNGDGKDDLVTFYDNGNNSVSLYVFLTGATSATPVLWHTETNWNAANSKFVVGDFNGDGKTDVMGIYDYGNNTTKAFLFPSTGTSFGAATLWWSSTGWNATNSTWLSADYNGDGKTDLLCIYDYGNITTKFWAFLSSGSNFPANPAQWWSSTSWDAKKTKWLAADFNADGRQDVMGIYDYGNNTVKFWAFLQSSGGAFPNNPAQWWSSTGWAATNSIWLTADFNGDGRQDIFCSYDYGNNSTTLFAFLQSAGGAFPNNPNQFWSSTGGWNAQKSKWTAGYFNGNGYADVMCLYDYGNNTTDDWAFLSDGSSFPSNPAQWWSSTNWNWTASSPF